MSHALLWFSRYSKLILSLSSSIHIIMCEKIGNCRSMFYMVILKFIPMTPLYHTQNTKCSSLSDPCNVYILYSLIQQVANLPRRNLAQTMVSLTNVYTRSPLFYIWIYCMHHLQNWSLLKVSFFFFILKIKGEGSRRNPFFFPRSRTFFHLCKIHLIDLIWSTLISDDQRAVFISNNYRNVNNNKKYIPLSYKHK
jgi:hypothetical protein